jgi:hypothetical protein
MARNRMVQKTMFTDYRAIMLAPEAKLFLIGLMTVSDDTGVFVLDREGLVMDVTVRAGQTGEDVDVWLAELTRARLLSPAPHGDACTCVVVTEWSKKDSLTFQYIDKTKRQGWRASGSCPAFNKEIAQNETVEDSQSDLSNRQGRRTTDAATAERTRGSRSVPARNRTVDSKPVREPGAAVANQGRDAGRGVHRAPGKPDREPARGRATTGISETSTVMKPKRKLKRPEKPVEVAYTPKPRPTKAIAQNIAQRRSQRVPGRVRTGGGHVDLFLSRLRKNHPWRNQILSFVKTGDIGDLMTVPRIELEDLLLSRIITPEQYSELT